ncbi:MAG: 30S ribosomal protein S1, partial [Clostridiales bacterium]|nr:30S ribosomal protein S1 [Clostridiales bacterium]
KSIDESGRIFVSHKELLGTWEENAANFEIGHTVAGIIRSVEPYGIFVELTPNLAGLAEYREGVSVGEKATVYIKNIIPDKMKVKLIIVDSESVCDEPHGISYYENGTHIKRWKYSPDECPKIIETVFE